MEHIAFIILHYKVEEVTRECIELLLCQNYDYLQIIVIDNYSNNGSAERLQRIFQNNKKIEFILMEKNYGFAKSNDVGFLLAKHKYQSDYIIIMNNDVMIYDNEFCRKLMSIEFDENVGVVGPDIVNLSKEHQNPLSGCITSRNQLSKAIFITRLKLLLMPLFYGVFHKNELPYETFVTNRKYNTPLHGACLIFLKPFINKFEYAFYPETFLYGEEELLYYLGRQKQIDFLYEPSLIVHHMEDVSTNSILRNQKMKRMFQLRNSLQSLLILKTLMDSDKK